MEDRVIFNRLDELDACIERPFTLRVTVNNDNTNDILRTEFGPHDDLRELPAFVEDVVRFFGNELETYCNNFVYGRVVNFVFKLVGSPVGFREDSEDEDDVDAATLRANGIVPTLTLKRVVPVRVSHIRAVMREVTE